MRLRSRALVALIVLAVLLPACSKSKPSTSAKRTTTTTTRAESGPPKPAPLTGLDVPTTRAERPLLVVKVDNDPAARPQAGLNQADVVFEEMVEGGATRFAAVYQSQDAAEIGPVRSARSTDVNLFTSANRPLFAYAGANAVFKILLRKSVFVDVGVDAQPTAYTRRPDRPAPSNLFTGTGLLYAKAPPSLPVPKALWAFRPAGVGAADGSPASRADIVFSGPAATKVVWLWDAAAGVWAREQKGIRHLDTVGRQVTARNVVIQFVSYKDSGLRDRTAAVVPEAVLVGQGDAWFLTDGKLIKGKWAKPGITAPTTYSDAGGKPMALTPGTTWVELPTTGSATVSG
jgi:hypothetical protein